MIDELGIGGYKLKQDPCFLKLGTDAMLLSHFTRVSKAARVCDLGTGNGAIAVLLAARHPTISLCGVEILPGAANLAKENVILNHLSGRMTVIQGDFKAIDTLLLPESFDCVVSNPPYLSKNGGLHTEHSYLLAARMEIDSTIDDVCRAASYLLKYGGTFSMVYRPERLGILFQSLTKYNLEPKRLRFVQNNSTTSPSLVLLEARKGGNPGLTVMPILFVRNADGSESEEIRRIYQRT